MTSRRRQVKGLALERAMSHYEEKDMSDPEIAFSLQCLTVDRLLLQRQASSVYAVYRISSIANGSKAEHTPTVCAPMTSSNGVAIVQISEIREELGHVCNERQEGRAPYFHGTLQVNIAPIRFFHARPTGSMPE